MKQNEMHEKAKDIGNYNNALYDDIPSIYQDKYVKITHLYILIDKYYFPLATSKTIFISEMKSIELKSS